jgi:phosphate starvation-inducible PhoH-like protein
MHDKKPFGEMIIKDNNGTAIYAKTYGQHELVKAIETNDIIFVNGCAGTGKTLLSCAMAAKYLKEGLYQNIVLTRPVVEAGEKLGFLPGELDLKIAPYMKPLYEFMARFLKSNLVKQDDFSNNNNQHYQGKKKRNKRLSEDNVVNWSSCVHVEPLAFMRGSTFENCILICDESENMTIHQMKMLLTRMGHNSKFIINGDITQSDLPLKNGDMNGLEDAIKRLLMIDGITIVGLTENDIVRHKLVRQIIRAYEVGRAE